MKSHDFVQLRASLGLSALALLSLLPASARAQAAVAESSAGEVPDVTAPAQAAPELAQATPAQPDLAAEAEADALADALADAMTSSGADAAVAEAEEFKLNIYGFTDFTYTHLLNDFGFATPYPTFMVGNINLYVGADLGGGWKAMTEFRLLYSPNGSIPTAEALAADPTRTDTTVGDPADFGRPLRWGGVEIERAWLEYSFNPLLVVRAGQWLTPYGIWISDHGSPVIIGVRRPFVVGEALLPERQTGVMVHGSFLLGTTELGYNLGLSNGRGPSDAYQDLDTNKAFTGRVFAKNESPIGNLNLGFSVYRGRFTDRSTRVAVNLAGDVGNEFISTNRYEELSMAADVSWVWQDLRLQAELIVQDLALDDQFRPAVLAPAGEPPGFQPDSRNVGWYAMGAYRLPWFNLMPFFGGEQYTPAPGTNPAAAALWGGLNWRPTPRVVLKGQLTKSWFTDGTRVVGDDGIEVIDLQAAWSF